MRQVRRRIALAAATLIVAHVVVAHLAAQSPKPPPPSSAASADPEDLLDDKPAPASPKPGASPAVAAAPGSVAASPKPGASPGMAASPKPGASPGAVAASPLPAVAEDLGDVNDTFQAGPPPKPGASPAAVAASPKPGAPPGPVAASPKPAPPEAPKPVASAAATAPTAVAASPKPAAADDLGDLDLDTKPASPGTAPAPVAASPKPAGPTATASVKPGDLDDLDDPMDGPVKPKPGASAVALAPPAPHPVASPVAGGAELDLDLDAPPPKPAAPVAGASPAAGTAPAPVAKGGTIPDEDDILDIGGGKPAPAPVAKAGAVASPPEIDTELSEAPPPTAGGYFLNSIGMKLISLPTGSFAMGSGNDDGERELSEQPVHIVTIAKSLAMGIHEVTQDQFRAVMGYDKSRFAGGDLPADSVVFEEARQFCRLVSEKEHKTYRLPTEAEWEFACRAGATGPRYSPRPLEKLGWFRQNALFTTHPVARRAPNAWGLYDMLGNVSEWCEDVWHDTYSGAPTDGRAWLEPGGGLLDALGVRLRVRRGGSIGNYPAFCRSAYRGWAAETARPSDHIGFRVVLEK